MSTSACGLGVPPRCYTSILSDQQRRIIITYIDTPGLTSMQQCSVACERATPGPGPVLIAAEFVIHTSDQQGLARGWQTWAGYTLRRSLVRMAWPAASVMASTRARSPATSSASTCDQWTGLATHVLVALACQHASQRALHHMHRYGASMHVARRSDFQLPPGH